MSIVTEKFVPRYGKQIDDLVGNPDRGFRTETVWYVDKAAESENPKNISKINWIYIVCRAKMKK